MQLSNKVEKLCNLLTENQLVMKDLKDIDQDMKDYLDIRSCLCYQNCKNLTIRIDNKINRIILFKCENIKINIGGFISGFEAKKCSNIEIKVKKDGPLNNVILEKCQDITTRLSTEHVPDAIFEVSQSTNIQIFDLENNRIPLE